MSSLKPVLVTGAAGGIGCALIEHLTSAGWSVIGTDYPGKYPEHLYLEMCLSWISSDLRLLFEDTSYLDAFLQSLTNAAKGVDIFSVVHNAAIQHVDEFASLSNEIWHETMVVNLLAPIAINRVLLPQLERQCGSIIHIGSIHNTLTKPCFTAYATSKAALAGFTRAMSVELGHKIRINSVEPAAISTPMLNRGFLDSPNMLAKLSSFHPTMSIGTPVDVARAVMFLLDPSNSFLNGCVLSLSGGIHNRLHDPF